MACGGTTGSVQKRLTALSEGQVIEWFTGWILCPGLDSIMPVLKARGATSDYFEAQVVIQTAKVRTNDPEDPVLKGTKQTASSGEIDYNPGSTDISSDTGPAMYVRFGVAYSYASGQSQSAADVELEVAYVQCGEVVGAGTYDLGTSSSSPRFVAVTGMLPAILVEEIKAAVSSTSLTGNFQWRLVYRVATTTKESPGAWNVLTDTNAPYTSGDINTGDLSVSLGSNMWVQIGVQYVSTSGAG